MRSPVRRRRRTRQEFYRKPAPAGPVPATGLARLTLALVLLAAGEAHAFDLQGHRGARGLMPENTLPAFALALEIGVSTLELDLAVTRDRDVVVMHDSRFGPALARDRAGMAPGQAVTAEQALAMYTTGAARALEEPIPLAVGSPADFIFVDRDPLTASPDEVRNTAVLATYVDGVEVEVDRSQPLWLD